jgi:DMSO/TMAO reductase YedYZ heme-binding membrane subunit
MMVASHYNLHGLPAQRHIARMSHRLVLLGIAAAIFGATALGGAWVGAGWSWDALNGIGFATVALFAFLCVETGAARSRPVPQAAFYSRLHRNLGVIALTGIGIHAIGMALADPVTLEYWKLSAPLYMLAGIAVVLLLIVLVTTAYPAPRRKLFEKLATFRRLHRYGAFAVIGLTAWHVLGSGFYLDSRPKQVVFVAIAIALPMLAIRRRTQQRPAAAIRLASGDAKIETVRIAIGSLTAAALFAALRALG